MPDAAAKGASTLPGVNVMLMGASGSGKTTSIKTLIAQGITPFCIFTEPGFEVLGDIPSDKLKWHYIKPADQSWSSMIDAATKVNTLSLESLSKMTDSNKRDYNQFVDLLTSLNAFVDDRTGEAFGDCTQWGTNRALVIDTMSGINIMAMNLVVGGKPVKSMSDWGIAMDTIERLIQKLCIDTRCHFVLMTHIEREMDEAGGGSKIMAATLGKKLAPKLPRFFSDVILAQKEGAKYTWSTAALGTDLKARNLPDRDGLQPDFGQIIESWKRRGGIIEQ
jgi:hypothetical protein